MVKIAKVKLLMCVSESISGSLTTQCYTQQLQREGATTKNHEVVTLVIQTDGGIHLWCLHTLIKKSLLGTSALLTQKKAMRYTVVSIFNPGCNSAVKTETRAV